MHSDECDFSSGELIIQELIMKQIGEKWILNYRVNIRGGIRVASGSHGSFWFFWFTAASESLWMPCPQSDSVCDDKACRVDRGGSYIYMRHG